MPDPRDLSSLLEQLRERHFVVYYAFVFLSALGVLGIVCLFDAILTGVKR
jgi:hypothetical protein